MLIVASIKENGQHHTIIQWPDDEYRPDVGELIEQSQELAAAYQYRYLPAWQVRVAVYENMAKDPDNNVERLVDKSWITRAWRWFWRQQ